MSSALQFTISGRNADGGTTLITVEVAGSRISLAEKASLKRAITGALSGAGNLGVPFTQQVVDDPESDARQVEKRKAAEASPAPTLPEVARRENTAREVPPVVTSKSKRKRKSAVERLHQRLT